MRDTNWDAVQATCVGWRQLLLFFCLTNVVQRFLQLFFKSDTHTCSIVSNASAFRGHSLQELRLMGTQRVSELIITTDRQYRFADLLLRFTMHLPRVPASFQILHAVGEDERAAVHVGLGLTLNHAPPPLSLSSDSAQTCGNGALKQQGYQVCIGGRLTR